MSSSGKGGDTPNAPPTPAKRLDINCEVLAGRLRNAIDIDGNSDPVNLRRRSKRYREES